MSQLEQITVGGGIRIQAYPVYLSTQSMPEENRYFFSYTIEITNERLQPVQLISRHWLIINADGWTQEVTGPGVVGQTPLIQPDESYVYTSFCPLNTSWGTMEGKYTMKDIDGNLFEVVIPRFVLAWDADTISE